MQPYGAPVAMPLIQQPIATPSSRCCMLTLQAAAAIGDNVTDADIVRADDDRRIPARGGVCPSDHTTRSYQQTG